MYVCLCRAITDQEIKNAIDSGINCFQALSQHLGVAQQCGKCDEEVKALLANHIPCCTPIPSLSEEN